MKYITENTEWISFRKGFNSSMYVEKASYFDERPQIHTSTTQVAMLLILPFLCLLSMWFMLLLPFVFFGWGKLYINLPIKTGIQDCESAAWGFNYHDNMIWIYIGGAGNFEGCRKWKTITMPWNLTWVRTSTLLKDNTWFNETSKNKIDWSKGADSTVSYEWLNKNKWQEVHQFTDKYDDTVVNATISISEREWRPLLFTGINIFSRKRRVLNIEFDKDVGKRKGSWKGGTIGCSYDLLKDEKPADCLRRMESEREF